jgi:hypothetical protein
MGRVWVGRRRERGSAAFYREQEGEEKSARGRRTVGVFKEDINGGRK